MSVLFFCPKNKRQMITNDGNLPAILCRRRHIGEDNWQIPLWPYTGLCCLAHCEILTSREEQTETLHQPKASERSLTPPEKTLLSQKHGHNNEKPDTSSPCKFLRKPGASQAIFCRWCLVTDNDLQFDKKFETSVQCWAFVHSFHLTEFQGNCLLDVTNATPVIFIEAKSQHCEK